MSRKNALTKEIPYLLMVKINIMLWNHYIIFFGKNGSINLYSIRKYKISTQIILHNNFIRKL